METEYQAFNSTEKATIRRFLRWVRDRGNLACIQYRHDATFFRCEKCESRMVCANLSCDWTNEQIFNYVDSIGKKVNK